jgi:hypothetical protein
MTLCAMSSDRPTLQEQYAGALGSGAQTNVVGAMGLADRRLTDGWVPTGPGEGYTIPRAPLAVALTRLFTGSNSAAHEIVTIMAAMIFERSWKIKVKISRPAAHDLACSVLAFHRNGTCRTCGGHGYELIVGAPSHSERHCKACHGTGKLPLEKIVSSNGQKPELAEMARWLLSEMEREAGRAAPEAMRALAPRLEL